MTVQSYGHKTNGMFVLKNIRKKNSYSNKINIIFTIRDMIGLEVFFTLFLMKNYCPLVS